MLSKEQTKNVFFAVAIVLLLVLIFRRIKVTCDCRAASGARSPQFVRPPTVPDDKLNEDFMVYGWPKNTEPPFDLSRKPMLPTYSAALSTSPQFVRPPAVPDDKLNEDFMVYGWPKNTEEPFDLSRKPILPTYSAALSTSELKKKAGSISLQPCTWQGEEACIKKGLPDGIFPQYPEIPFNNPYPYYNPAASEDNLNPWPNPPRDGVVPEQFNPAVWKPERWKPDSAAWVYKDTVGRFPSVIYDSRQRYYEPPFSRRQPPYYLMDYPQYPDRQSFYKWFPNSTDKEPVTDPVWPFTVEPVNKKAGLAKVRPRKRRQGKDKPTCEDEPNYHDFVAEQKSYY